MNHPWMPLYVADYLADTAHLTAAESGAYLHLIMHYWLNGSLPDDDRKLSRIARMSARQWADARPIIADFFEDGWRHKRVEFELTEAARISAAGKKGGEASGRVRRAKKEANGNDQRTTVQRPFNDPPNDLATNCEALPSPSQLQPSLREGKSPRAHSIPEDWQPSEASAKRRESEGWRPEWLSTEAAKYKAYYRAHGDVTLTDWDVNFDVWLLRAVGRDEYVLVPPGPAKAAASFVEILPGTAEWTSWGEHYRAAGRRAACAQMLEAESLGKPFAVPTRWPPEPDTQAA